MSRRPVNVVTTAPPARPDRTRRDLYRLVALVVTTALALLALVTLAAAERANASSCYVTATAQGTPPTTVTLTPHACTTPPVVALQAWLAPSPSGNPISAQRLLSTPFAGPLTEATTIAVTWDIAEGCDVQLDAAFGPPRKNLTTPYGPALIYAWHAGVTNCLTPPTSSAPPTTSTPPTTTAPPTSSAPPTTTAPPTTSTPPTTAPPTTTHPVVIPPTTPPAPPSPTTAPPSSTPPTTPAHPSTTPTALPFTGSGMPTGWITALGTILILFGIGTMALSAYLKRTHK